MADLRSAQVTVTTTATVLAAGDSDGQSCVVLNASAGDVYVGGDDVTTSNGLKVAAGQSLSIDLARSEALYGRVASGTAVCHVLRSGV